MTGRTRRRGAAASPRPAPYVPGRLGRLGLALTRWRVAVVGTWLVLTVAGGVLGGSVFDTATPVGLRADAESTVVAERLEEADPEGETVVAVLSGTDALGTDTIDAMSALLYDLAEEPGVADVVDPWTSGATDQISDDRQTALVLVELDPSLTGDDALAVADDVADTLRGAPAYPQVLVGGETLAEREFIDQAVRDAAIGEGTALVVLLVLLSIALGGVLVGSLPVVTALVTVAVSLLGLAGLTRVTSVSEFAVNVVTVLGIGLCVDYCLLVVARFREERVEHGAREDTGVLVARTLDSAGRTVLVSGATFAVAMLALLLLGDPLLTGLAVGGLAAVGVATLAGLTLAPAVVALAPERVGRGRRSVLGRSAEPSDRSPLARLARLSVARPWPVLLGSVALLLLLAAPLLGLRVADSDVASLPRDSESRQTQEALERALPDVATKPLTVLVDAPSDDPRVVDLRERIGALDGTEPDDVVPFDPPSGDTTRLVVVPDVAGSGEVAVRLVDEVRALDTDLDVQVGGPAAELLDSRSALVDRLPFAAAAVVLLAGLLLLALTGSLVVAVKTLVLTALSLAATLGVVVGVFGNGWGAGLIGVDATGTLDITTPLLLFLFAFGLSMDYHVFLVARIQEAWRAAMARGETDLRAANDRAIVTGITASGPVVTLAAIAIVVVFLGFAAGKLGAVKEIGVGMTVAVLLDVTVVRGLLLPAAMSLLGARNWWRPSWPGRRTPSPGLEAPR